MTTITFKDKIIAADGRCTLGDTITSETTNKIFKVNNCLVGFAGRYASGLRFVQWFEEWDTAQAAQQELPFVNVKIPDLLPDEDFTAIVAYPDGAVMQYEGGGMFYEVTPPIAIGSGMVYALAAMDAGASAEEAVKIATKRDIFSGGEVRTLSFDEESEDITKEKLQDMSKEDIIAMFFPEGEDGCEGKGAGCDCGDSCDKTAGKESSCKCSEVDCGCKLEEQDEEDEDDTVVEIDEAGVSIFTEGDIYTFDHDCIDESDWSSDEVLEELGMSDKSCWIDVAKTIGVKYGPKDSTKKLAKRCQKEIKGIVEGVIGE